MIKRMIRKSYLPIQTIFYVIRRRRNTKKMMNYYLGIKANHFTADCAAQGASDHGK